MSDSSSAPRSSPAAGCIILSVIVLVFGGLIVLYTARGLWMNREIDKFTTSTLETQPIAEVSADESAAVIEKLVKIRDAALGNQTERITFNADELNALIASQDALADFRGTTFVESISEEGITTRVSQTLRGLKPGTFRYLNGTMDFIPLLRRKTIVFQVRDIRVTDKEVPQKFIESYSSQDLFKLDANNKALGPVMRELERIYLEEGQMVVETRTQTGAEKAASDEAKTDG